MNKLELVAFLLKFDYGLQTYYHQGDEYVTFTLKSNLSYKREFDYRVINSFSVSMLVQEIIRGYINELNSYFKNDMVINSGLEILMNKG